MIYIPQLSLVSGARSMVYRKQQSLVVVAVAVSADQRQMSPLPHGKCLHQAVFTVESSLVPFGSSKL